MTSDSALRHIPEDTLELYCMGHLSESETEPVEEHLLVCNLCQDAFTETAEFLQVVRAAAEQLESQPQIEVWWKRWLNTATAFPKPVLAMAACALALFVIIPNRTSNSATVELQTMRGPETAAQAPANTTLTLKLAVPETGVNGPLELRVADSAGSVVQQTPVELVDGKAVARVNRLAAGSYWARLYTSGNLVLEYSINVR